MAQTTNASPIIDHLKSEAASILQSSLGSATLEPFNITSAGNFPYVWQNPANLAFNEKTYDWIDKSLKPGVSPYQFESGTNFTNLYLQAASNISWSLSKSDQVTLNKAAANATKQQAAVLNAWKSAFGSIPSGATPINDIADKIATEWANPAADLTKIQNSVNLDNLLNKVPAAGKPIVPVFVSWLNALGASVALQNQVTMNNAYLRRAIQAIQSPSDDNGGLTLDDQSVQPAYAVAQQVSDIENAMADQTANVTKLDMTVSRSTDHEYQVTVKGGAGGAFALPVFEFITIGVGAQANYFHDEIATANNSTTVSMTFPGTNLVTFGPTAFAQAGSSKNWFWMDPVRDAIGNGYPAKDVSGFKFATQPTVSNWDVGGPFGYVSGTAIANYPTIKITVKSSDYKKIQTTFQNSVNSSVSFLGIPLASASEASYSNDVQVDASNSTVTITLSPPQSLVAGNVADSVGWILGTMVEFPAAK